jgi:hypothetical protein
MYLFNQSLLVINASQRIENLGGGCRYWSAREAGDAMCDILKRGVSN